MTYLNLGLTNLMEYVAKGAQSAKHTISFLCDLQRFRTVLAPGTQSRSCYHYITGTETVESVSAQLSLCGGGGLFTLACCGQRVSWTVTPSLWTDRDERDGCE